MNNLFKEVLSMSLSGSLLILLILLIRPIVKNRFSKAWQYYLWIIVLIRLLVPFSPEFSMANNLFHQKPIHNYTQTVVNPQNTNPTVQVNNPQSQPDKPAGEDSVVTSQKEEEISIDLWRIGIYLWLSVMVLFFLIRQIRYFSFLQLMKNSSEPVADKRIKLLLERAAREVRITRVPQLKVNSRIASPMLIGLIKPSVYLTDLTLGWDDARLYYVLRHELMHYKRHDLWYKWFSGLIQCIHWFNPLVAVMNKQINLQCEISCDEAVARDLSREEKMVYGNVLLDAVSENTPRFSSVLSSTLYEDKKSMKERISTIIMANQKSKKSKTISIIITLVFCAAAFWLGAYTMGGRNTQKSTASTVNNQGTNSGKDDTSNSGATGSDTDNQSSNNTDSQNSENSQNDNTDSVNNGNTQNNDTDNVNNGNSKNDNSNTPAGSDKPSANTSGKDPEATAAPDKDSASASENDSIVYSNTDFGFDVKLPADWKGYTIVEDTWQGTNLSGKDAGKVIESGTKLLLRNPNWTKKNPYQDIPIMIFTKEQWKAIEAEEVAVSAAPVPPSKLAENSKYVFALPPRYNFAFPTGYEEVEKIMDSNPITGTENMK
jgi:beta-lactamase regulating signal transducer with metallopeptidase domain